LQRLAITAMCDFAEVADELACKFLILAARSGGYIGHFGTGDLEITLSKPEDLERAMPLIKRSYENS
jgi:predicted transport protein